MGIGDSDKVSRVTESRIFSIEIVVLDHILRAEKTVPAHFKPINIYQQEEAELPDHVDVLPSRVGDGRQREQVAFESI